MFLPNLILEALSKKLEWELCEGDDNCPHGYVVRAFVLDCNTYIMNVSVLSERVMVISCVYNLEKRLGLSDLNQTTDLANDFMGSLPTLGAVVIMEQTFHIPYQLLVLPQKGATIDIWVKLVESSVSFIVENLSLFVTTFQNVRMGISVEESMKFIEQFHIPAGNA